MADLQNFILLSLEKKKEGKNFDSGKKHHGNISLLTTLLGLIAELNVQIPECSELHGGIPWRWLLLSYLREPLHVPERAERAPLLGVLCEW